MKHVLCMAAGRVFDPAASADDQRLNLSVQEILSAYDGRQITLVLHDPSYVSDSEAVSLKTKRDRRHMAIAKFQQLGAIDGFGSWCIARQLGVNHWFAWAIDPASAEAERLKKMIDGGVDIQYISSELFLAAVPRSLCNTGVFLRVRSMQCSVQLALYLCGHWVFARRIDTKDASAVEEIAATLRHLKAQGYIGDSDTLKWQLFANTDEQQRLSVLWQSDDPCLAAPCVASSFSFDSLAAPASHYFNSTCTARRWHNESRALHCTNFIGCALVVLLLSYLLPFYLLSVEAPAAIPASQSSALSEEMANRYWQMSILESQKYYAPQSVSALFSRLLVLLGQNEEVELLGFSALSDKSLTLRCQLRDSVVDPVHRFKLLKRLRSHLLAEMPEHRVSIVKGSQFSVGEVRTDSVFEVLLEARDE